MIRVRLFGGFEAWHGETRLRGFESQKVRALFSYLACQKERAFSRDHLAGLLWTELDSESARHALRQAIYNLRSALPGRNSDQPPLLTSHLEVRLNPEAAFWLDIAQFEEALGRGRGRDGTDPHHLTVAAQLYRGDFLAGFFVRDCPQFEDWLIAEQERLRDSALEALRSLIVSYRNRGELRFAIHYGRQLVALDPLAEEPRRDLIQLLGQAGRRSEALTEYEALCDQLDRELGVQPIAKTRAIFEAIRDEPVVATSVSQEGEPIGPFVPLVGRQSAWEQLERAWGRTREGQVSFSLLVGPLGIGKTRLVRSFLDAATGLERATVLRATGGALGVPAPYHAWQQILWGALQVKDMELPPLDQELSVLLKGSTSKRAARPTLAKATRRAEAVANLLRELGQDRSLILFFDDLDEIDQDSLALLAQVIERIGRARLWIVASAIDASRLPSELGAYDQITLDPLALSSIEEITSSLVGEDRANELAKWLFEATQGLPLAIAERINLLWDQGNLSPLGTGRWSLAPLDSIDSIDSTWDPTRVLRERLRLLPSSTRRLASVAALCATPWNPSLLEHAGEEHPVVVALGLEVLLKRWLIRPKARFWTPADDPKAALAWVDEPRLREYEFTHAVIRRAVLAGVDPVRRRMLHAQLGGYLEASNDHGDAPEEIAAQLCAAQEWRRAIPFLKRGLLRAEQLGAERAIVAYRELLERARTESSTVG